MTQEAIYTMLSSIGIPVGFNRIKKGTALPFLTYHITQPDNFSADNVVYYEILNVEVRVYEEEAIDPKLHNTIKSTLKNNGIYWTTDSATDEEEQLTITYYYFGGISNE